MNPTPSESDGQDAATASPNTQEALSAPEIIKPLSTGKMRLQYRQFRVWRVLLSQQCGHSALPRSLYQRRASEGIDGQHDSFEGAVIQPMVGSASDRLRTPLGRRRHFMLIFAPLSALLILLTQRAATI